MVESCIVTFRLLRLQSLTEYGDEQADAGRDG